MLSAPVPGQQVLVRNRFVGINATDINFTAGRYSRDNLPLDDLGLESVAEVVAVGDSTSHGYKQGDIQGWCM